MEKHSKIYIAGHRGLVGSAIIRKLESEGFTNLIYKTHSELDLTNQKLVQEFFDYEKPDYVFLSAGKVGGIQANNTYPAEFIYQNIMIETNIIHSAYLTKVKKLLFLASSCIYPRNCPQPIKEEYLLSSELEPTNEAYAIAKIAGLKLCKYYKQQYGVNFISAMPTNLYGIEDHYDLENSHVLPARLKICHDAKINNLKSITMWGTGNPRREFMYVDDLADALLFLMLNYNDDLPINIGTGRDIKLINLVNIISEIVEYNGDIIFDKSKPDGTPQKLLDVTRLTNLGWVSKTSLIDGIKKTYDWFKLNYK